MAKGKYRRRTPEERARSKAVEDRMARILERIEREEGITREQALGAIERLRASTN